MSDKETMSIYLDLAAAKARQIAVDVKAGRTYYSDVQQACSEIIQTLNRVQEINRNFEAGDR